MSSPSVCHIHSSCPAFLPNLRLDQGTSGVVCFARTEVALKELHAQFRDKVSRRKNICLRQELIYIYIYCMLYILSNRHGKIMLSFRRTYLELRLLVSKNGRASASSHVYT